MKFCACWTSRISAHRLVARHGKRAGPALNRQRDTYLYEVGLLAHAARFDAKTPMLPFADDGAEKRRGMSEQALAAVERWLRAPYATLERLRIGAPRPRCAYRNTQIARAIRLIVFPARRGLELPQETSTRCVPGSI